MPDGQLKPVITFLRRLVGANPCDTADRELLVRFADQHDETAFAALVQRHGPMVLGVCRRVLGDPHDAEDAFQATFLVLVRKAGSIGRPELLGNWLYGVAQRTAVRARARRAKRHAREGPLEDVAVVEPTPDLVWRDVRRVLDEEVRRLPEKFRVPFVLCCLEGNTTEETARALGCPTGTVLSRLWRARERLRRSLAARGVALSEGALVPLLAQNTLSAVAPAVLADSTASAATLFAAGNALPAGAVSQEVLTLTQGVLHAMFIGKLQTAAVVLLALAAFLGGSKALVYLLPAAEPTDTKQEVSKPSPEKSEKLKALLKERVATARDLYRMRYAEYQHRRDRTLLDPLVAASHRLLDAERAAASNRAEKLAALEAHWQRLKGIEEITADRVKKGSGLPQDYSLASKQAGLPRPRS